MPVLNVCEGCQGPMCGPSGYRCGGRCSSGLGPNCSAAHRGVPTVPHGSHAGVAGSYFACGAFFVGGCTGGLGKFNCGPCCGP